MSYFHVIYISNRKGGGGDGVRVYDSRFSNLEEY